jgi:5'-3' exonuclease
MRTEVIFNFVSQLLTLSQNFDSNQYLFIWDSKARARRKVWPEYKTKKEEKTPEEIEFDKLTYPQFSTIRMEVLPAMGFKNIFIQTGMEADDIIASIVLDYRYEDIMIISRDGDLHQLLLNDNISQYDPQTKKVITRESFIEKWNIEPEQWAEVKAIAGCKSDEIDGVDKVAEKTAIKYLNQELKSSLVSYANIEASTELIDRNRKLVKLPFDGTNHFEIVNDDISLTKFMRVFEKYDFQYFLRQEELSEWERGFKL